MGREGRREGTSELSCCSSFSALKLLFLESGFYCHARGIICPARWEELQRNAGGGGRAWEAAFLIISHEGMMCVCLCVCGCVCLSVCLCLLVCVNEAEGPSHWELSPVLQTERERP